MARARLIWIPILALGLWCCGDPERAASAPPPPPAEPDLRSLEALAGLGYVESEPEAALAASKDELPEGVLLHSPAASDAFRLITSIPEATALLIDASGHTHRTWRGRSGDSWKRARLCANGDLLVVGGPQAVSADYGEEETGRFLARLRPNAEELWRRELPIHHDALELQDGRIAALFDGPLEERGPAGEPVIDALVALLDSQGAVERTWSITALLRDLPGFSVEGAPRTAKGTLDLLHANSLDWIEAGELTSAEGVYAGAEVLVSLRHQSRVALLDLDQGRATWWFGAGLEAQHEASLLRDGNVLLFDNGLPARGYSRLLVIDPRTDQVVREWRAPTPADFHSKSRGTVELLANGNLLVGDSNRGEIFEVAPDGTLAWRYASPFLSPKLRRSPLRVQAYERPFLEHLPELLDR